mmetsp:Transcript_40932/g.105878  ORF Transcript_40932/g.105878 Transcript_40932/m.105878 type:complete len:307 (-) Transcript_40932:66-986(-)
MVVQRQQVAGVRVGVEHAVAQDHDAKAADELGHKLHLVQLLHQLHVQDGHAIQVLHHQDMLGGEATQHAGYHQERAVAGLREVLLHQRLHGALPDEVKLKGDDGLVLPDEGEHVEAEVQRGQLEQLRKEAHVAQVGAHHALHAPVLNLHHHGLPIRQRGSVDLRNGGARQRQRIDPLEHVLRRALQVLGEHAAHMLHRLEGHLVVQAAQAPRVHRPQHVRLGGQDLLQLEVKAPEVHQHLEDLLRARGMPPLPDQLRLLVPALAAQPHRAVLGPQVPAEDGHDAPPVAEAPPQAGRRQGERHARRA